MISTIYHSPLGDLVLEADARGLVLLRFADTSAYSARVAAAERVFASSDREDDGALSGVASTRAVPGSDALSGAAGMSVDDPADAAAVAVLSRAWAWLNAYFAGQAPCWLPPLHMAETAFAHAVWSEALAVPAGEEVALATFARRVIARPGALDDGGVPVVNGDFGNASGADTDGASEDT